MSRMVLLAAAPALLVAAACSGGGAQPAAESAQPTVTSAQGSAAPAPPEVAPVPVHELRGVGGWINSEPLTVAAELAEGRVVLIDFWTYTCVNCIRTLPFLQDWYEKYADRGLTIIGVHAPEFEFEKSRDNVLAAVKRFGLKYPVAQDNEMATWREFNNRSWPGKHLIGADGELRYQVYGEGQYRETEVAIREALTEAGWDVKDIPVGETNHQPRDPSAEMQTRELYGGYRWNYSSFGPYAAQAAYYDGPDREVLYEDSPPHENHFWYLQGLWRNDRESIVHARVTEGFEDYIALRFRARTVNVVLRPLGGEAFDVRIELDGRPLAPGELGADVELDADGRSILRVDEPRLYAIVEPPTFGEHELKLRARSDNFAIFAFTFGVYEEGP